MSTSCEEKENNGIAGFYDLSTGEHHVLFNHLNLVFNSTENFIRVESECI